jgi:cytochrome c-type biogenesis protein
MIDAAVALALASGMVAAVNPCGFAMLPAYVSLFLGLGNTPEAARRGPVTQSLSVSIIVSLGFVAVFGFVGIALQPFRHVVVDHVPWATVVIGLVLAVVGVRMLAGRQVTARLPKLDRGGRDSTLLSMFLYGVSYAVASLSCTISIFMANVVGAFSRTDTASAVVVLLAYAAGIGLVITALTLAIALARESVVRRMRAGMRHVNRAAGALVVVMGAYVAWYGVYSLRVRSDPTATAGPAEWVDRWSADVSSFVNSVGPARFALCLLAVTGGSAFLLSAVAVKRRASASAADV